MKLLSFFVVTFFSTCMTFGQTQQDTIRCEITDIPVTVDGEATEECWEKAEWHAIDQVLIPYNTQMKTGDFEGWFKVAWDTQYLYLLVEVVDDSLSDDHADPYQNWWDDDCVEIFIDENRSGGDHERNCNAFAYHVSLTYDALDLNASGGGVNYKDNIRVKMDTIGTDTYLWEFAIKMYDASFLPGNPEPARVYLEKDKLMGFAIAYCDNDETTSRENFIGSMVMTAAHYNDMYKNADYFGPMLLTAPESTVGTTRKNPGFNVRIYPVPAQNQVMVETFPGPQRFQSASISDLSGQIVGRFNITGSLQTVEIKNLSPGIYLLQLHGPLGSHNQLIVKE